MTIERTVLALAAVVQRDADKLNHTGMVRYGNEPLQLWSACPGMSRPDSIAKSILAVDFANEVAKQKGLPGPPRLPLANRPSASRAMAAAAG